MDALLESVAGGSQGYPNYRKFDSPSPRGTQAGLFSNPCLGRGERGRLASRRPPQVVGAGQRLGAAQVTSDNAGGVYVDSKEEKRIVAIRPKAAFQPLFAIAAT